MKHCMYCNTLMAKDAIFCPKCGKKQISKNIDSKSISNSNNNSKSKYTAWLLWLFLGWTGAHRFYLHVSTAYLTPILYGFVLIMMFIYDRVSAAFYGFYPGQVMWFIGFLLYLVWWIIDAFHINRWLTSNDNKIHNTGKLFVNYRFISLLIYVSIMIFFITKTYMMIYVAFGGN